LLELGNRYHDFIVEHGLTMFEIDMLIAAVYFKEEHIDIALYEVGLGGRLDATNIILPELCLITNIGMDHMEYLGDTLSAIAGEKAGIIKQGVPVITGERKEECLQVFREVCRKTESTLDLTFDPVIAASDPDWVEFTYRGYKVHLKGPALYQSKNASLVIDAALKLRASGKWQISDEAILKGLSDTLWKGRFEVVHRDPTIVLDGAHNDHGVEAILTSIQTLQKPVIAVFTALKDKNARNMLEKLLLVCDKIIVTEFSFYRGAKAVDLAGDLPVEVIADPREALRKGLQLTENGSLLITGSLYFISDVRNIYLSELIGKGQHD
jgi:dihydrofolate synthase/folylpolyglutamate synthase